MNVYLRNMTSVYLIKGDRILLLLRQGGRVVNNVWIGTAGGHFEEYELNDPKACVIREMEEETGLTENDIEDLQLRYITLRRISGEIRQNYFFFARLKDGVNENIVSNEGECKWFPLEETGDLEMSYSAKYALEHYRKIGRFTSEIYVGAATGERVDFLKLADNGEAVQQLNAAPK
ncbi:MAG: NUDIX domain-containing protein [Oscillospiraceae bacterium]|nr:NUDIX domain-containing protein [Oscillospiraceae bacterium]